MKRIHITLTVIDDEKEKGKHFTAERAIDFTLASSATFGIATYLLIEFGNMIDLIQLRHPTVLPK